MEMLIQEINAKRQTPEKRTGAMVEVDFGPVEKPS
jgi:hypothetical protein